MNELSHTGDLVFTLRKELSPFHYQWLCACAVYPSLRWPFTVWLGACLAELDGRELPDEDAHLPLIRLPWFRVGAIPENIRLRLLQDLSPENGDFVRRRIEAIFATARALGHDRSSRYILDLKRPPRITLASLLRRREGEESDPAEDPIFLRYMMGRVPSGIDFQLDRLFTGIVGAQVAGRIEWHTLRAASAAILLAISGWYAGRMVEQRWNVEVGTRSITLPAMVEIPAGQFRMGSQTNSGGDETPAHEVSIGPFAIGKFELTFKDWDNCVADGGCNGYKPDDSGWGRDTRPVIEVSWYNAQDYVAWINRKTRGGKFRLPSEAEWEYAARAGTKTAFPWGDLASGKPQNFADIDSDKTVPIGQFPANGFELFDMIGNVSEWVADCYHSNYVGAPTDGSAWNEPNGDCTKRVHRGGSYGSSPPLVSSAARGWFTPTDWVNSIGFRIARTLN